MNVKLTVSELEDLTIEGEITTEAGVELNVVKEGRWVSEGKFESKTVIFTDGERHYRGSVMREGSPFTDYTWGSEWDSGDADIEEVAEVPVTTTEWQPVLERGVHVYEEPCPEEGSYILSQAGFEAAQKQSIAEFGEDIYVVVEQAVRTVSGWSTPGMIAAHMKEVA